MTLCKTESYKLYFFLIILVATMVVTGPIADPLLDVGSNRSSIFVPEENQIVENRSSRLRSQGNLQLQLES
jgi:hypothetical protein